MGHSKSSPSLQSDYISQSDQTRTKNMRLRNQLAARPCPTELQIEMCYGSAVIQSSAVVYIDILDKSGCSLRESLIEINS